MKYCTHCGKQIEDDAMFCPECGTPVNGSGPEVINEVSVPTTQSKTNSTLALISFILCLISTISVGFFLIPLLWMIPLTIKTYNHYSKGEELSSGMKVCILLFVNMISGILLLCEN